VTSLVVLGVALRTWAYVANPPLWLDEILLARNILGLSVGDLLMQPLKLDQVAPKGFLLAEKLSVLTFGETELALRLFPFLCGIAGMFLFRSLAERILSGWAVSFAVGLFAIGIPFIFHGAEVKQYELDPTAAIGLMLLTLWLLDQDRSPGQLGLAGLAGFAIVWFSQTSVLVMAGLGLALAVEWGITRDRRIARVPLVTIPVWAVAGLVAIWVGIRSMTPSTREFMYDFWGPGFVPRPLEPLTTGRWLWNAGLSVFTEPTLLRYRLPALFLVLAPLGLVALWRQHRAVALVLAGPGLVALVAALLEQYPFRGRLMFYLVPGMLLAIAAAAEWIRAAVSRIRPALGAAAMTGLALLPVAALVEAPPPYDVEHTTTLLAYLSRHRQAGDVVYVLPLSRIGALFYGPSVGVMPSDWITGICDRNETRTFVRDVDRHRGKRIWLLSAGQRPYRAVRQAVRSYLSTIGVKRDSLVFRSLNWESASIELYDLTDPGHLGAANAETFPVLPMPTDPRPGCRPWAQPSPVDSFLIPLDRSRPTARGR